APIGTTTPGATPEHRYASSAELERWVQSGLANDLANDLATDVGNDHAQINEPERDSDSRRDHLALLAAIDDICQPRTRTRATKPRVRRAATANDAAMRLVPVAGVAAPQQSAATAEKMPEENAPANAIDIQELTRNFVRLIEQGGKAMAACLKPRERGRLDSE